MQRAALSVPYPQGRSDRSLRWVVAFGAAVALAIGAGALLERWAASEPALQPATVRPGSGPRDYSAALAEAEAQVASRRQELAKAPDQWLREELLAGALIERQRLTGEFVDLAEADRLIDAGLARAPDPSGPVLSRAALSLMLHRIPHAEAALTRVGRWKISTDHERADALALAGDIAQQRGDVAAALASYGRAHALAPSPGIELRLAMLLARSGERDEAKQRLEALLAAPRQAPRALANLALQRAQLGYAEGDWAGAGEWITAANRFLPGYWLADAYAAQQSAIEGRVQHAIRRYAVIAERTNSPEVMDALAQLLRLQGRRDESLAWWARADTVWRERLARFPEAASLHAAEHALIGGRLGEALALARSDAARRPHGASLAVLARALTVSGQPREALAVLDRAEQQRWSSAGLLMLRADASAALGDEAASESARERAEAINPHAADPRTRLIWFGHD